LEYEDARGESCGHFLLRIPIRRFGGGCAIE